MKSASNIINSQPKDQFPNLKYVSHQQQVQQLYQSNLQSSKMLGPPPTRKKNSNNDDSTLSNSKRNRNTPAVKSSNSQSKYSVNGSFKVGYMHLSNSQNKFLINNDKQPTNISHNLDRSPHLEQQGQVPTINKSQNSITKKKLAGVILADDITLPPLGQQTKNKLEYLDPINQQIALNNIFMPRSSQPNPLVFSSQQQQERLSVKQNITQPRKMNYMVNYQYKSQNGKKSATKVVQSQMIGHQKDQDSQQRLNHNGSFTPHKQNDTTEVQSDSPLLPLENLPNIEQSKVSSKNVGVVSAYGANTHQGLVRNYNEDRVSIILNMMKPTTKGPDVLWPQCSFFAIYDGHGGSQCAEFLRDSLHYYIIRDENFPQNPKLAIKRGFEKAEKAYLEIADSGRTIEKSGSCAVVALIVDDICYVANVGDSRAVASSDQGQKAIQITVDHKPNHPDEEQRITSLGGQIYQSQIPVQIGINKIDYITGPFRVLPGRLAVSRTMGDSEAKLPKYNGIPNVISAEPDVFSFKVSEEYDFLLLGCDGIFDKMSTKEVIQVSWGTNIKQSRNVHDFTGKAIENVMRMSLQKKSFDNVTVVLIAFAALEKQFNFEKKH